MALVDKGNKNRIVFTIGTFARLPSREFIISLPYDWPVNNAVMDTGDPCAFPMEMLFALASYRLDGNEVNDGFVIARNDAKWSHLKWPDGIDGLVAVDCSFSDPKSPKSNRSRRTAGMISGIWSVCFAWRRRSSRNPVPHKGMARSMAQTKMVSAILEGIPEDGVNS